METRPASQRTSRSEPPRATKSRAPAPKDALQLLRADHKEVQALFDQFEKARSDDKKSQLAQQICKELTVHARIEEELFYPAARDVLRSQDLLDEAEVEHASAKALIAQIEASNPGDPLFEARVLVLGEYIRHHVKEEQNELFPKVKESRLDTKALGAALAARKAELLGEEADA